MKLKIYRLYVTFNVGYDSFDSKVIVAKNKDAARKIANQHVGDEGMVWEDRDLVKCKRVKTDKESVVCESFNAG